MLKRIDFDRRSEPAFRGGRSLRTPGGHGTGDAFDRLAESLNTMLTRIERLMLGLKQVSDNIAHDLKTP